MLKHKAILTKRRLVKNIFSDRSSLVLRALLREPEKKWTLSELAKEGVSLGLASDVLSQAETLGYVERFAKGPESYTRLIRKEDLLADWAKAYSFERNDHEYYLSSDKNFMKKCAEYLRGKKKRFVLSGYSASRLISPYVKDDRHFFISMRSPANSALFFKSWHRSLIYTSLFMEGMCVFCCPSTGVRFSKTRGSFEGFRWFQIYNSIWIS